MGYGRDIAWNVRASAFELLAMGFRYPTPELASAISQGEFFEAAEEIAEAMGVEWVSGWTNDKASNALLASMKKEYTSLFIGTSGSMVDPYECVWDAREKGTKPLLFVSPKAVEVEKFCKACGLGMPDGKNEPFDHIAVELELLEYLASLCAGIAVYPEGFEAVDFPGGSPAAAYSLFIEEHLGRWAYAFGRGVKDVSQGSLYGLLSDFLLHVLEAEGGRGSIE